MESQSGLTNNLNTTMTTYQLGVSTRFGAKTVGSINASHTQFDSDTNPYSANSIVGTVATFF